MHNNDYRVATDPINDKDEQVEINIEMGSLVSAMQEKLQKLRRESNTKLLQEFLNWMEIENIMDVDFSAIDRFLDVRDLFNNTKEQREAKEGIKGWDI